MKQLVIMSITNIYSRIADNIFLQFWSFGLFIAI
jgi:hypothetical protein